MLQDMPELCEKIARRSADAKEMRHLADDCHVDEAFDEAAHNRRRDKASYPPHAHDSKRKEKNADHDSEGGGERTKFRSTRSCDGADSQCGDQTGGGVRSDDELTRRTKQRISEQGRDYRVEAHDWRHTDNTGVSHSFGHHDRPKRDAGKGVGQQPFVSVGFDPVKTWYQPARNRSRTR